MNWELKWDMYLFFGILGLALLFIGFLLYGELSSKNNLVYKYGNRDIVEIYHKSTGFDYSDIAESDYLKNELQMFIARKISQKDLTKNKDKSNNTYVPIVLPIGR